MGRTIIIRDRLTNLCVGQNDVWIDDLSRAKTFPSTTEAVVYGLQRCLFKAEVVVFTGSQTELSLPIQAEVLHQKSESQDSPPSP